MQTDQKNNARFGQGRLTIAVVALIAIAVIAVLAVLVPRYRAAIRSARESVLKEDLQALRDGIRSYTADKKKPPQALGDLLAAGYLAQIPEDPVTHSKETWVTETTA